MAKKPEKPVYSFMRVNNMLIANLEYDLRALDGIANGQSVSVEIKEFRNRGRHRAYWMMLSEVVAATECTLTIERLHDVVKLETGLIEIISLPNGMKVALPGSIAFDKIGEAEFVKFFESAERWLSETYGYVPKEKPARAA